MRNLIVLVGLFALYGCGEGPAGQLKIAPAAEMVGDDKIHAESGVDLLMRACPGLTQYGPDLKSVGGAKLKEATLTDQRLRDWSRVVEIELLVSEHPSLIPAEYRANGHHCYFDVGVYGPRAGVVVSKQPCVSICQAALERSGLPAGYKFFLAMP